MLSYKEDNKIILFAPLQKYNCFAHLHCFTEDVVHFLMIFWVLVSYFVGEFYLFQDVEENHEYIKPHLLALAIPILSTNSVLS